MREKGVNIWLHEFSYKLLISIRCNWRLLRNQTRYVAVKRLKRSNLHLYFTPQLHGNTLNVGLEDWSNLTKINTSCDLSLTNIQCYPEDYHLSEPILLDAALPWTFAIAGGCFPQVVKLSSTFLHSIDLDVPYLQHRPHCWRKMCFLPSAILFQ